MGLHNDITDEGNERLYQLDLSPLPQKRHWQEYQKKDGSLMRLSKSIVTCDYSRIINTEHLQNTP